MAENGTPWYDVFFIPGILWCDTVDDITRSRHGNSKQMVHIHLHQIPIILCQTLRHVLYEENFIR